MPSWIDIARKLASVAITFAILLATQRAAAQAGDSRVLAQSLFQEGKRLLDAGQVDPACEKLAESQKLEPAGGTLLNLARCHELQGKIATAWTDFQGALELSKRARRPDRMAHAKKKIDELGPKVPYLTLRYAGKPPPGLEVHLDGVALGSATLDTSLALDPGDHELSAEAAGHTPFALKVTLTVGEKKTVVVGPLEPLAPKNDTPAKPPADARPAWILPTAIATGGAALVAHLVTLGTGVRALDLGKEAESACPALQCTADGLDAVESGRDLATAADVTLVVGIVLAAGSGTLFAINYVWFSEPATPDEDAEVAGSVRVEPRIGLDGTYVLGLRGTF